MAQRTPEQKAADEALSAAVEDGLKAYGYAEAGGITTGFVVIVDQRIWRGGKGDGEVGMSAVCALYKDGDMPWVQILGLLRLATLRLEAQAQESEVDEE